MNAFKPLWSARIKGVGLGCQPSVCGDETKISYVFSKTTDLGELSFLNAGQHLSIEIDMSKSLLKLQLGPVQDFIAQARSTRDLWSGSYLISWMMAHAIKGLQESCIGKPTEPVEIIFPMVADKDDPTRPQQPLVRYLREFKPASSLSPDFVKQILSPNLSNLLLAVVPGNWTEKEVKQYALDPMRTVWREEQAACLTYYEKEFKDGGAGSAFSPEELELFEMQAKRFWQFTWQLWPMHDPKTLLGLADGMPESPAIVAGLEALVRANARPDDQRLWETHCRFAGHRLDARRQTRNFDAWPITSLATRDKDSLSGREEAIANKDWLARARETRDLRYRFRSGDQLGAPNLIKRVWDLAYLKTRHPQLVRARVAYDSVPGVAAASWLAALKGKWADGQMREAFERFSAIIRDAWRFVPQSVDSPHEGEPPHPLDLIDAQVFHVSSWEGWMREADEDPATRDNVRRMLADGIKALENLYAAADIGKPGRYFAVLALDGDEMGKWLSGQKQPQGSPLTKAWHLDFSQTLAGFALDHVRIIVEKHHGQPIYAGGDDVLAMLPAETAIACAIDLAEKFRACVGAVAPKCTASVGIAMAHMRAPLQDVVASAQDAERTAKGEGDGGFGRDALAVTLFKRSGELVEWGARFQWTKLPPLLELMRYHYHRQTGKPDAKPAISGRFPHLLIERLGKFDLDSTLQPGPAAYSKPTLLDIAKAEFNWVVGRQTGLGDNVPSEAALKKLRADLCQAGGAYLDELARESAPLRWFTGLFSVEAFLNQQRD